MKQFARNLTISSVIKNIILFVVTLSVVLFINLPVISFDMMYPEQPSIYIANQTVNSFRDLINLYMHPTWLHANVPFFRPSGHFLVYQLITPFIGWHNTKAFIVINMVFLALTGFFSIKIYKLLFPSLKFGGYIAFSIYLSHPALSISRLTIMHFEFAYVCFAVMSLYVFTLYCQYNLSAQNNLPDHNDRLKINPVEFQHQYLFYISLLTYMIATSFKEPAIMLGPVLFCYFCIMLYRQQPFFYYLQDLLNNRQSRTILIMITGTCLLTGWYFFQAWPSFGYAAHSFNMQHSLGTANAFLKDVFGLENDYIPYGSLPFANSSWRTIVFPPVTRFIIWSLFWLLLYSALLVYRGNDRQKTAYQKSLLFLLISSLLFLVLPLSWASGAPWHHSLTLICLGQMMGFGVEYFFHRYLTHARLTALFCVASALLIAATGITVNRENISKYKQIDQGNLGLSLNRNAVLHPPAIHGRLDSESIIVVEDSILHSDYMLGNAAYPFLLFLTADDYNLLQMKERNFYLKFHHTYSGTLFRYAYLMPSLREELYPFQVEKMNDIPNEIIYNWLKHYNNIFCFGYDRMANWHDKSNLFKQNLLKEQHARGLIINNYVSTVVTSQQRYIAYTKKIPFPDVQLCQFTCDQDKSCKGFIYDAEMREHRFDGQCYFYMTPYIADQKPCKNCMAYTKKS